MMMMMMMMKRNEEACVCGGHARCSTNARPLRVYVRRAQDAHRPRRFRPNARAFDLRSKNPLASATPRVGAAPRVRLRCEREQVQHRHERRNAETGHGDVVNDRASDVLAVDGGYDDVTFIDALKLVDTRNVSRLEVGRAEQWRELRQQSLRHGA